ncbi:aminopeptidase [Brevibacillus choshinensis]|uniref:Aminopeptidase n=1 Tax=Brevibacillus choshinensis TaxID=54911 RepID=A0ABR5N3L9_BRECH|nr:M55 family metallopeptidase [Brevibacillus choshinensis]KQL45089.1 aminopeptidase [Brevibacillus choshinensis]
MKVFISVDMEGISGVIDDTDVDVGKKNYEYCRRLLTQDVNAAIEGALEAGATEILVNDSHDTMKNVILDELNPQAQLISGFKKPFLMMEGIDENFDAAFFIGYHGKAGTTNGILNHTLSGKIQRLFLNGKEVGEAGLNASLAAAFGVPVVLVTGDTQTAAEVEVDIPGVFTVAVKEGKGTNTGRCLHPSVTRKMIKEKAKEALQHSKNIKPLPIETSYTLEVEFKTTMSAQMVSYMPNVELLDGRTIRYQAHEMTQVMPVVLAMLLLSAS